VSRAQGLQDPSLGGPEKTARWRNLNSCRRPREKFASSSMGKPSITQVLVFPYEYNAEAKKLSDGRATDASWGIHSLETATSTGPEVLMQCVRRYHSEPLTTAAGHAYILHRPSKSQQGHHFRASPMCGAAPRSAGARD
jgi:hypothetical protein